MPKAALLLWEVLNWLVLIPAVALCVGVVRMKPGGGPQGGEFYFCGLFFLAAWIVLASGANAAVIYGGPSTVMRFVVFPGCAVVVEGVLIAVSFKLLNDASLVRPPDSHLGLAVSGSAIIVLLALANAIALRVAAMTR